jgi:3-dehydroquinate dehydratase type I
VKVAHEFNELLRGNKPGKCKLIVSSHNYENTPSVEELGNLVARIQAAGADIVKIATTALDISDVARIFQITVHSQVRSVRSMLLLWIREQGGGCIILLTICFRLEDESKTYLKDWWFN